MERISSFFLMGFAQRSKTSFNACMKKDSLFWAINVEISFNTKTRLHDLEPRSRVNAYFHLLIKIQNCFSGMCWRRMFCFSLHSPWEINLKSFPFKMVLSWKQCSCDVIIERVYWTISAYSGHTDTSAWRENWQDLYNH
jgi:hypothetical protein